MFKKVFRIVFVLCGMLFGYGVASLILDNTRLAEFMELTNIAKTILVIFFIVLFAIIFDSLFDALRGKGEKLADSVQTGVSQIPAAELLFSILGLAMGMFMAYLLSQIVLNISLLQTAYIDVIITVLLYTALGFLGFYLGRRISRDGIKLPIPRAVSDKTDRHPVYSQEVAAPKVLDTSVIIDGRIQDVLKTGFLEGNIIIPDFVLVELRHIADSADDLKRNRGRRGLDILNQIQEQYGVDIYDTAEDAEIGEIPEVDVKLLKLAENLGGFVVTNDFNLNKVATIQGIRVLNINDLANSLKPITLPGESLRLVPVKEGKEAGQAVAYLDDGTMIVIEGGRKYIGKPVETSVTSILQTSAGRMIFVRPKEI